MAMKCPNCGVSLQDGASFCDKCGLQVGPHQFMSYELQPQPAKTSEKIVNAVGSLRGRNLRTVIILAIVACILIGFFVETSVTTVSKLRITFVNHSSDEVIVRVYVDDLGERVSILGPNESVSYLWNLTGWLHKYSIVAFPTDIWVEWYNIWTNIIILPFTERVIVSDYMHGV